MKTIKAWLSIPFLLVDILEQLRRLNRKAEEVTTEFHGNYPAVRITDNRHDR